MGGGWGWGWGWGALGDVIGFKRRSPGRHILGLSHCDCARALVIIIDSSHENWVELLLSWTVALTPRFRRYYSSWNYLYVYGR